MPWKEICPMNEKVSFIANCSEEENFSALCKRYGISRKTGYKWVDRYNELGVDGLKDRPPISLIVPHRTAEEVVDAVIKARKEHPTWGPKKLRVLLATEHPQKGWPAPSTIGELLKRYGLIRPRRRRIRTPPGTCPFPPCQAPNDVWSIDFKGHFALSDGTRCHPLTISDCASRYLLKCEALVE